MQTISSTIKILLIENDWVDSVEFESFLSNIKSNSFRLTKTQDLNTSLEFIKQYHPDLIFYVVNQHKCSNSNILWRLQESNAREIPLILISTIDKFDINLLELAIDDYLIWSDISTTLLEKTICLALKRTKNRQENVLISHENIELDSQLLTTKNLFQTIVDNTSTLIWMCDEQGNSTFFNQAWSRLLGQKIETKLNSKWMLNIHPQDFAKCYHQFNQALSENKGFKINYRLKCADDQYRWISNYAVPQFAVGGKFEGLVGYCFDITSHKIIEQKLIQRAASDRLLAHITQKIHASFDLERILETTVAELHQFLQAEKIQINRVQDGKLTLLFESRCNSQPLSCDIAQSQRFPVILFQNSLAQLAAGHIAIQENVNSPMFKEHPCSILMIPILPEQELWGILCIEQCSSSKEAQTGEIKLLERVALELSVAIKQAKLYQQLEEANQELEKLSVVDGLTKIANRRKFDQYIAAEWTRLAREQNPLSVILCDIDHFKLYNDTYGHIAGDLCLEKVAQAISKVIKRPADLVARYGGEEFVFVLPNTPISGAKHLAQEVRLQIEAQRLPHINSPVDLYVTLSLGVSCCIPNANFSFHTLVTAADKALYQAKATGRNRVVEYEIEPE